MSGDVRQLLVKARIHGLRVEQTRGGHYRISRGGRSSVTVSSTPSKPSSLTAAIGQIRRVLGVDLCDRPESKAKRRANARPRA